MGHNGTQFHVAWSLTKGQFDRWRYSDVESKNDNPARDSKKSGLSHVACTCNYIIMHEVTKARSCNE